MTHGDNNGLVLPPRIAPIQVMVIPVAMHKAGVLDAADALLDRLKAAGIRAKIDDSDQSMGWKCCRVRDEGRAPARGDRPEGHREEPVRPGPPGQRRERSSSAWTTLEETAKASCWTPSTTACTSGPRRTWRSTPTPPSPWRRPSSSRQEHGGFIKTMWCGELDCELKMKEEAGMTSRCVPFAQEHLADTCPICGRAAKKMIYWGVAY